MPRDAFVLIKERDLCQPESIGTFEKRASGIAMKTISFIEKLPFRPYLLCSKPIKPGHNSVLPSHILRVLLTKYGKMVQ